MTGKTETDAEVGLGIVERIRAGEGLAISWGFAKSGQPVVGIITSDENGNLLIGRFPAGDLTRDLVVEMFRGGTDVFDLQ